MANIPELIYCAGGNRRFAEIALAAGFRYGCELTGDTPYAPVYFADQDWNAYKKAVALSPEHAQAFRARYMAKLAHHRPTLATVLDWERDAQLAEVLDWAEEAAAFAERVLIIPKVAAWDNPVRRLPRRIGRADVVIAYSVPSRYGGTDVPIWQCAGWPIHLLGGSPHGQMRYDQRFSAIAEVVSVDGNMTNLMAQICRFWSQEKGPKGHWRNLKEVGMGDFGRGSNAEAFRRSCENVVAAWKALYVEEVA